MELFTVVLTNVRGELCKRIPVDLELYRIICEWIHKSVNAYRSMKKLVEMQTSHQLRLMQASRDFCYTSWQRSAHVWRFVCVLHASVDMHAQ